MHGRPVLPSAVLRDCRGGGLVDDSEHLSFTSPVRNLESVVQV